MARANTVVRNTLWGVVDVLVELVLPMVTSVLVARAMGPEKLGSFVYIMWIALMASSIGSFGIPSAATKYLADYAGQRRPDVVSAYFRWTTLVQAGLALALVCGLELWVWLALPLDERGFASLAILSVLPYNLMGMASVMNAVREDLRANALPSIIGGLAHAVAVVLVLVLDGGLVGLAGAHLLARVVDATLRWAMLVRRLPPYLASLGPLPEQRGALPPLPRGLVAETAVFCLQQSALLFIALVVRNRSEMVFLKQFCDLKAIAFYSLSFGFSQLPGQLATPFSSAAMASLFIERGRNEETGLRFLEVYFRYMALIVLPASLGLTALSGPLIRTLYGPAYYDAVPVMVVAAAFSMARPLGTPQTHYATSAGKLRLLLTSGLWAAAATLILDAVLIYAFGAVGAAWANGLGQVAGTVGLWVLLNRACGARLPGWFMLRLSVAVSGMALVVVGFAWLVPDAIALIVGPFVGVVVFAILLRLVRVLEGEDVSRLVDAGRIVPARARPVYLALVRRLVAAPPPAPQA